MATTCHDLRQPLQALILLIGSIETNNSNSHTIHLFRRVDQLIKLLNHLLTKLLDYSRIRTGFKVRLETIELQPILFDIMNEFGDYADKQGIFLRLKETNLEIQCDSIALKIILKNLISNAIKFTQSGGVLLSARRRKNEFLIEVWDTGIGIHGDQINKIFDTYYQINNPERNIKNGIGLGLSMAKELAKHTGGRIEVRSRFSRGSVFRYCLPIKFH
jgi:signal transduction histidine kinase